PSTRTHKLRVRASRSDRCLAAPFLFACPRRADACGRGCGHARPHARPEAKRGKENCAQNSARKTLVPGAKCRARRLLPDRIHLQSITTVAVRSTAGAL